MNPSLNADPSFHFQKLSKARFDPTLNLELGCHANMVKDLKQYEILPGNLKGFGVATCFVPIESLIKEYTLNTMVETI